MKSPKFGTDWTPPAGEPRQLDMLAPELFDTPKRYGHADLAADLANAGRPSEIIDDDPAPESPSLAPKYCWLCKGLAHQAGEDCEPS